MKGQKDKRAEVPDSAFSLAISAGNFKGKKQDIEYHVFPRIKKKQPFFLPLPICHFKDNFCVIIS